jgi:hypothetical protein
MEDQDGNDNLGMMSQKQGKMWKKIKKETDDELVCEITDK